MFVGLAKEKDFLIIHDINSSAMTLLKKQSDDRTSKFIIKYFLMRFGQMGEHIPRRTLQSKKMDLIVISSQTSNINTANAQLGCFTVQFIRGEKGQLSSGKKHGGV